MSRVPHTSLRSWRWPHQGGITIVPILLLRMELLEPRVCTWVLLSDDRQGGGLHIGPSDFKPSIHPMRLCCLPRCFTACSHYKAFLEWRKTRVHHGQGSVRTTEPEHDLLALLPISSCSFPTGTVFVTQTTSWSWDCQLRAWRRLWLCDMLLVILPCGSVSSSRNRGSGSLPHACFSRKLWGWSLQRVLFWVLQSHRQSPLTSTPSHSDIVLLRLNWVGQNYLGGSSQVWASVIHTSNHGLSLSVFCGCLQSKIQRSPHLYF